MSYFWPRASNDFGASHFGIMGFNHFFYCLWLFSKEGCTIWTCSVLKSLKRDIHFDCRHLELWNAYIVNLVFIVLNVRDGTESKYPSFVFLSIFDEISCITLCMYHGLNRFPEIGGKVIGSVADPIWFRVVRLNRLTVTCYFNILWKFNNLVSVRPNYLISMEYLWQWS